MAEPGPQQSLALSITVSGGAGVGTITSYWAIARWVRVCPINETDTYDLTIKDADGKIMVVRTSQLGTMSERLEISMGIMRTITIANATADGTYVVKFDLN